MLFPLLIALAATSTQPRDTSCPGIAVVDSLASEIGDGSALNRNLARQLRRTARHVADTSKCEHARYAAEEMAFDLSDWLDRTAGR